MTSKQAEEIRVVHVDPDGFGEVDTERREFEAALPGVRFDSIAVGDDELADRVGPADVLLTHYTRVDRAALDAISPRVIVRYATGVDGIDLDEATRRGIAVINIPTYCDDEVADHVIASGLSLLRGLPQYNADCARGGWNWRLVAPPSRIADCTFGFLGFGRKAQAAAARARALGCRILAHDPHQPDEAFEREGAQAVDFDTLLRESRLLSLHAPLTPETEGMIDARALALLPAGAVLINTARGLIVDEAALADALDRGHLMGAALDVLSEEPPPADHPLLGRDNVIVTPHSAWYSTQAERLVRERGSHYALAALRGEDSPGLYNKESLARR